MKIDKGIPNEKEIKFVQEHLGEFLLCEHNAITDCTKEKADIYHKKVNTILKLRTHLYLLYYGIADSDDIMNVSKWKSDAIDILNDIEPFVDKLGEKIIKQIKSRL